MDVHICSSSSSDCAFFQLRMCRADIKANKYVLLDFPERNVISVLPVTVRNIVINTQTSNFFEMTQQLLEFDGAAASMVGGIYIFIGMIGFICNLATLLMIASYRMYRLSAYTIMANLALADAVMLIVAGLVCGFNILQVPPFEIAANHIANESINDLPPVLSLGRHINELPAAVARPPPRRSPYVARTDLSNRFKFRFEAFSENLHFSKFLLSFFEIAAWTAGVISYAFLGINRCVAICFYRTKAKTINRVSFALIGSTVTWIIGSIAGLFTPDNLVSKSREI